MNVSLPEYKPTDRSHLAWVRAVVTLFQRFAGRELVLSRYVEDSAPYVIADVGARQPSEVRVLNAINKATLVNEGSPRIHWKWSGSKITVSSVDVSDSSAEYDIAIMVRE